MTSTISHVFQMQMCALLTFSQTRNRKTSHIYRLSYICEVGKNDMNRKQQKSLING